MKLQFSLATMLIAATAGAGLMSACSKRPEHSAKDNTANSNDVNADLPSDAVRGAEQTKREVVSSRLRSVPIDLCTGESFRLILSVQIAPGWHIAAIDKPTGSAAATKLDLLLPAGMEQIEPWQADDQPMPDPHVKDLAFMHTGEVRFHCVGKVLGSVSSEHATIRYVLGYQACNNFMCRMPEKLESETELHLTK